MEGLPSIAAFTGKIERPTGQRQLLKKREGSNQAPGSNTSKFWKLSAPPVGGTQSL